MSILSLLINLGLSLSYRIVHRLERKFDCYGLGAYQIELKKLIGMQINGFIGNFSLS